MYKKHLLWAAVLAMVLASCNTTKQITYFQDIQPGVEEQIQAGEDIRLAPDDKIGILVSSKNQELALTFNLPTVTYRMGQQSSGITNIKQDGQEGGAFKEASIGEDGIVSALYTNGETVKIAKIALSSFAAPDNLTPISGTLFEANGASGNAVLIEDGGNYLVPQALEQSTANVEKEFSKMVVIQRAYGMNSSSFTVADEMLQVVRDLKS